LALFSNGAALADDGTPQLQEAELAAAVGAHAVVAQGYEAGGHRGVFDPEAEDSLLGTFALVMVLTRALGLPVIAAGGIMDGAGIAAKLLGAGECCGKGGRRIRLSCAMGRAGCTISPRFSGYEIDGGTRRGTWPALALTDATMRIEVSHRMDGRSGHQMV